MKEFNLLLGEFNVDLRLIGHYKDKNGDEREPDNLANTSPREGKKNG